MTWFGSLDLAYKYTIVFLSLLVFTITAGLVKVLYNRRKLKQFVKNEASLEAGARDDQMELNQREKDEGDLFGVRAIEAGFYAGIPQSRPGSACGSRAGSVMGAPSMSTNTLVGSFPSPKIQSHSMSSSVTSLPLAHTSDRIRDSDTLPGEDSPPRRKSPPAIKLRPSEAELSGRINHNAAVNMNLRVPPSPVLARPPQSPVFGGSDDGSDENLTPRSLSPRSANFKPEHYAPVPPQIPMPEGLRVSVHSGEATAKSQTASFNSSPTQSAPSSPGHPPLEARAPSMPSRSMREEPRSLFPAYTERRDSLPRINVPLEHVAQPTIQEPSPPASPIRLQPHTYQPTHQRDMSDASSIYSAKGAGTRERAESSASTFSYNYSFPETSSRNSVVVPPIPPKDPNRRRSMSASSSLQAPGSSHNNQTTDPRFSEFYDAYYRHSQLGVAQKSDAPKRPNQLNLAQPTIVEVPSPLMSPHPPPSDTQPGMAI